MASRPAFARWSAPRGGEADGGVSDGARFDRVCILAEFLLHEDGRDPRLDPHRLRVPLAVMLLVGWDDMLWREYWLIDAFDALTHEEAVEDAVETALHGPGGPYLPPLAREI